VTALGLRLLPTLKDEKYSIHVYKDEKDEIMHGIGLKLSSHHVDSSGEKAVEGTVSTIFIVIIVITYLLTSESITNNSYHIYH